MGYVSLFFTTLHESLPQMQQIPQPPRSLPNIHQHVPLKMDYFKRKGSSSKHHFLRGQPLVLKGSIYYISHFPKAYWKMGAMGSVWLGRDMI